MKLSKDELKKKVTELVQDNEIAIELLEDIEDSFESGSGISEEEYNSLQEKLNALQEKYKNRFLNGDKDDSNKDEESDNEDETEELEEKEVIDVKEI